MLMPGEEITDLRFKKNQIIVETHDEMYVLSRDGFEQIIDWIEKKLVDSDKVDNVDDVEELRHWVEEMMEKS